MGAPSAYPVPMERDLRTSPLYQEVEEHFRKVYEPGFGRVTEASDPPSPDGRWVAFTGCIWEKLEGTAGARMLPRGRAWWWRRRPGRHEGGLLGT